MSTAQEGTFRVRTTARPPLVVSADGRGAVSHSGSRLVADLADRTSLTGRLSAALADVARLRTVHDPGRALVDLAVAVADGAECISDIAVLADQPALFGAVASDSTVWRLLDSLGEPELVAVARARAAARELVWAQRAETTDAAVPAARAAGVALPSLVIDIDASIDAPAQPPRSGKTVTARVWVNATDPCRVGGVDERVEIHARSSSPRRCTVSTNEEVTPTP
jgi:hypothetical protein